MADTIDSARQPEPGRLLPPYGGQTHCQAAECQRLLDEEVGAYWFTEVETRKWVVFCGATAAYVELHARHRFARVML